MVVDTIIKLLTDSLLNCTNNSLPPPAADFLSSLTKPYVFALISASIICAATIGLFVVHLIYIGNYVASAYRRAFIIYLAGTAPFVSGFALVALFMPRVWFLAHLLSFFYYSIGIYALICLLFNLVDGKQAAVKRMTQSSAIIGLQSPPFCCLFPCLPKLPVQLRRIRFCELMVMQCPCTVISLALYFEYLDRAFTVLKILDFISLPSLLCGIYGCHILVNTISRLDEVVPYRYNFVFRLFDFYFLVFGLQMPVFDFLARLGIFGCGEILPALETAFFWKNFATVIESLVVSVIATLLLRPTKTALFDKYHSCRSTVSSVSMSTIETTTSVT
ncbi:Organic solute transporter alpha-like protein 2 [Aphelenchoides besseyi]|nr:Organic solute transporter alpha-like protein 2 [Aphelenchoides besseyi]